LGRRNPVGGENKTSPQNKTPDKSEKEGEQLPEEAAKIYV